MAIGKGRLRGSGSRGKSTSWEWRFDVRILREHSLPGRALGDTGALCFLLVLARSGLHVGFLSVECIHEIIRLHPEVWSDAILSFLLH